MADDITRLGSRLVYENPWMRVREDAIRRGDGSTGVFGVVEQPDYVIVAALEDGFIHLVEQFRYPVGRRSWELVQGGWEDRPDADPAEVARGELAEETGLIAAEMRQIGRLLPLPGRVAQTCRVFVATSLSQGPRSLSVDEQDLVTRAFPIAEAVAMVRGGVIRDAGTVAAFGLLSLNGLI